jgi:concentrative nucleoside transporter, CNT family
MQILQPVLGIAALIAFAWLVSENRRAVAWKRVGIGLAVSLVLAVLCLKVPPVTAAFGSANSVVDAIAAASRAGTSFVFGYVGGGPLPFELKNPGNDFVLAFQALPIVLVMSVLTTLLFYWGILPPIIRGFSWSARWASAARSGSRLPPTSSSAMSRHHCSSAPTLPSFRAVNCSW